MNKISSVFQLFFMIGLMSSGLCVAQSSWQVSGQVKSIDSNRNLPFVKISVQGYENHAFTNIEGEFEVSCSQPICTITFETPLHRAVTLTIKKGETNTLTVVLPKHQIFAYQTETGAFAKEIMQRVIANAPRYDPKNQVDFKYQTYNKLTLNSGNLETMGNFLKRAINAFGFANKKLLNISDSTHLLLSESVTERKYLNSLHQKETVLSARLSNIEKPTILTINSTIQPFSLYSNSVNIAGKAYNSPLMPRGLQWYYFQVIDTSQVDSETVYTIQFNPWWKKRLSFLKGYLYINASDYSLRYASVSPTSELKSEIIFSQSYQKSDKGEYFPYNSKTGVYQQPYGGGKVLLNVESRSLLFGLSHKQGFKKRNFDEVILDYEEEGLKQSDAYWNSVRQGTFTQKDRATYALYDTVGRVANFDKLIRFGESVYYGELPAGGLNLNMRKIINYNQFEGLRLGFGARTNERLFQNTSFGAYIGFGLRDAILKYGGNATFTVYQPLDLLLEFTYSKDVEEAGGIPLAFQENQFSSESVRNLRLSIMDLVEEKSASIQFRVLKNLQVEAAFAEREIAPQYNYAFNDTTTRQFVTDELRLAFRYAHGERYLKSLFRKISLGTAFPIVWFQWRTGSPRWGSDYQFHRFDVQLRQGIRLLALGKANFQLSAGVVRGAVPYSLLYNGNGSFRDLAAIAHNSFETMNYNEFLSDRYVALYYAHNFGNIYLRKFKKQPSVEMLHNVGFGSLDNPEAHLNFPFKTMEKGFFESGLFLNNILVLKVPGFQTGVGAGVFVRYGAYAFPTLTDNLLFKLAIDFQL